MSAQMINIVQYKCPVSRILYSHVFKMLWGCKKVMHVKVQLHCLNQDTPGLIQKEDLTANMTITGSGGF